MPREPRWAVEQLDVLAITDALGPVGAVICDPPYSSGGMLRGDRIASPNDKYLTSDSAQRSALPTFTGDNKDARSYGHWSALWMALCHRIASPGAPIAVFTDWRQLPATADALQAGGWIWRGVLPWRKPINRPQPGRFRAECEFIVWGSKGPMAGAAGRPPLPGFYEASTPRNRSHVTQKPLAVMRALMAIADPGATVLDPFAGSGTTGVAAVLEGRDFLGLDVDPWWVGAARDRIRTALLEVDHADAG